MNPWVYDIECYPNLFMITFIPLNCNQKLIDAYIAADIANNGHHKKMLLEAIGTRSFVVFKDYEGTHDKNDIPLFIDFMSHHKILYGFNSFNYDSLMLDFLLYNCKLFYKNNYNADGIHITKALFDESDRNIGFGKGYRWTLDLYRHYKRMYEDRDIQKILYLDKSFTGLKKVAINLRWYRLQELPIKVGTIIKIDQIEDVRDYNINDDLITRALILDQQEELEIRESGSKEFNLDLRNMSRSSIGKSLVTKFYSEILNIPVKDFINERTQRYVIPVQPILDPKIHFTTPEFNKLFDKIRHSTIYVTADKEKSKWGFSLLYNGTKYVIAKGGLHSKDDARIQYPSITEYMRDADITSAYPKAILNRKIHPAHIDKNTFLAILQYIMTSRVDAKKESQEYEYSDPDRAKRAKKKAEIYKIVINRIYGAFNDAYDYLYDTSCTYKTTVNVQLYLLMLCERLETNGIHVISVNTDGVVCKFNKLLEDTYNKICSDWEKELDFELEFTDYEKYIRNDVNNYIAIKVGFEAAIKSGTDPKSAERKYVKRKGLFVSNPDFSKGFINPVVSIALNNYYIYGKSILETFKEQLKKPNGIYDFCITQKIDKKFEAQYHRIEKGVKVVDVLQQYNRFYISSKSCGILLKYNPANRRTASIVAKENTAILNVYKGTEINDVKFSYYGNECSKIMDGGNKKGKYGISSLSLDFDYENDDIDYFDDFAEVDYTYLYEKDE